MNPGYYYIVADNRLNCVFIRIMTAYNIPQHRTDYGRKRVTFATTTVAILRRFYPVLLIPTVFLAVVTFHSVCVFYGQRRILSVQKPVVCDPNWRHFELLVPLCSSQGCVHEFEHILVRSLLFLWPAKQTNLVVVLDAEAPNRVVTEQYVRRVTRRLNNTYVRYNRPLPSAYGGTRAGWYRQQWLMLWADNFTGADYVGFVDSDTVMTSVVDGADLFDAFGRPRIIGRYRQPHSTWAERTEWALGAAEVFTCMNYFPVIVATAHVREAREHMRRRLRGSVTFDAFYRRLRVRAFSQFNLLCNYLWYYRRGAYHWHVQLTQAQETTVSVSELKSAGIYVESQLPHPRVANHYNYARHRPRRVELFLVKAFCFFQLALRDSSALPNACHAYVGNGGNATFNDEYYYFESRSWKWHWAARYLAEQRGNRFRTAKCKHVWDTNELKRLGLLKSSKI